MAAAKKKTSKKKLGKNIVKVSMSDNTKPKRKVIKATTMRKLEGKIIWIESEKYNENYTGHQYITMSIIRGAELVENKLSFFINCDENHYDVNLKRVKGTLFQGDFIYTIKAKKTKHKIYLQVFENEIGMFLTGTWDDGGKNIWESLIHLYFI